MALKSSERDKANYVLKKTTGCLIRLFTVLACVGLLQIPTVALAKEHFVIPLPIDLNQADALTLTRVLTGVGPKKAEAIVLFRQQNGNFESVEDLVKVKGIGPGTLKKNQGRIVVNREELPVFP